MGVYYPVLDEGFVFSVLEQDARPVKARPWGGASGWRAYARQRTDQDARFAQYHSLTEETDMSNQLAETGWKRFLDRLKQLWGKSERADVPAAVARTTDADGASTPPALGDTPAPSPGGH